MILRKKSRNRTSVRWWHNDEYIIHRHTKMLGTMATLVLRRQDDPSLQPMELVVTLSELEELVGHMRAND